ncbi:MULTISPECIES: thermonuclease family protein [unclassified Paracoccus (in: a-proteobacteria)]|uniref:thermonuclease family protein n=1 Tax=unclassified Paracoccus (in: a-proteobacteria) TaxID=2688777 RepID=UPI0015FF9560|nr:thermonuclease family protein [Paracoccus sp. MC1862]MBB1493121.1 thermonuclease family protein [Paracoccus sp. MC1854]MBB1499096.1 thermonuclease family protein [Paracoccus sp. MC1862]QQO46592.1 thermonuclease family protein [Paracoccus sp. MC1862]
MAADHPQPQGRPRWRRLIVAAAALLLIAALVAFSWPQSGKEWHVIDGDTLELAGERIRLFGIDAPERGQSCGPVACGTAATDALADILSAGPVRCTRVNTDRYGRTVARCRAGRHDVNREMVRRGMAWAYRQYGDDYVRDEKAARTARIGIWKYKSQPAWNYRAGRRTGN